ncbi:hypothetical protein IKN40_04585 [bacterium]|nr:hypothetical protein [bacterium]
MSLGAIVNNFSGSRVISSSSALSLTTRADHLFSRVVLVLFFVKVNAIFSSFSVATTISSVST